MSLTATNAQVYKGTAAVTYGSGSGVSGSQLQGSATITYGGAPTSNTALVTGSSNYMKLPTTDPTNFDPSTSNVFVEAWVYWNGTNTWNSPNGGTIYERDNVSTQDYGMYTNSSGQLTAYMYTQNGNILRPIYNTVLSIQTWYHVAFGYNIANQTAYVWVNGNIGTTSTASNPARYTGSSIFTSIGASPLNGTSAYFWNGYIRDMRVVKGGAIPTTSFTPAAAVFGLGTPTYVSGGSTVLSLYEQYFNPSLINLPGTTGTYMDLSTVPKARVNTSTTSMFIEAWCYFNTLSGVEQYIAGANTVSNQSNDDWGLRWDSGVNKIQAYHYNSSGTVGIATSLAAPNAGQWYHVAVSFVTGNPGYIYLFVNGVLQNAGGASMSGLPRYSAASTFWIGSPGNTNWGPSNVRIQDLRIVQGGTVPTTTFTPGSAPFGVASPSYVSGGTTVFSLATQYYQTGLTAKTLFSQISSAASASATGIFSLYAVNGISPLVVNVRNGTTAATSDFYGDIFGNLTTSAGQSISSWLGAATGYVTTWYDQSGKGNHMSCSSTALQPIIDPINKWIDFKSTAYFDTSANPTTGPVPYSNAKRYTVICKYNTIGNLGGGICGVSNAAPNFNTTNYTNNFRRGVDGFYNYWFYNDIYGGIYGVGNSVSFKWDGTNRYIYTNSSLTTTQASSNWLQTSSASQMIGKTTADMTMNGEMYYIYMFDTALSDADRNIMENVYTGKKVQFTNRPILPAVLTNPGPQTFTIGGTTTVSQTALQPVNGITWGLAPSGQGVNIASSTDYALTLSTPASISQNVFTVTATNKSGLTTVTQFTGATPVLRTISSAASTSVVGMYSLRSLGAVYSRVVNVRSSGFIYPPIAMTSDNFTATGTYNGITNGVYISSASSAWGGSEFPFSAFDKNFNGTRWTTSSAPYNGSTGAYGGGFSTTISGSAYTGEWLQLKVPSATVITSYTIYTSSFDPQRTPVDFKVAGSNDGTTWTVIDTRTGITSWLSSSTSLTFTVTSSPPAYLYFRLVTNKNGGSGSNGYLSIGEWVINNIPANTDFYADTLGNLTTAAGSGQTLAEWLGGATGYVTTWYDQSGYGTHASQATLAYQPVITSSLIASNIFGLNFQNTCGLATSAFTNSINVTVVMVIVIKSTIVTWGSFAHHGSRDNDWAVEQNGSSGYIHWQTNNDNVGDQLAIIYDKPMVLYCTMTNGTAMSFQMLTSTSSYVTSATETSTITLGSKIMYIGKSDAGEACNSYIGEFNYFQSVLSDKDQTAFLADVCSRWGIANFNPLFQKTSSTVKSAVLSAYSLRDLYGTSPIVVNVRRSSDNSTQDFYADTRGNLTTLSGGSGQTLASWLGSAVGYVTTWYDQSGLGNHATQSTSSLQPFIQRGTKGPGYALVFTSSQYLTGFVYSKLANTKYTVCEVDRRTILTPAVSNGVDNAVVSCGTNQTTDQLLHITYRSGTAAYYGQFGDDTSATVSGFTTASTEPVRYRFFMASSVSGSGRRIYVYGDPLGYVTNFSTSNTALLSASGVGNFYIGYYSNGPTYYHGELYETIVFNNSLYDLDNTANQISTIYDSQYDYINTSIQVYVPPPLLLQVSSSAVSAAVGMYILRSISSAAYTKVLTIRNGTTSVTQDFYADRGGNLQTSSTGGGQSVTAWLSGAIGYVTTWYDQSSVGNHATQTNTSLQPTIDEANKQIVFNGSTYFNLPNGTVPYGNTNYTMCVRHGILNTSAYNVLVGSGTYGTTSAVNAIEVNTTYNNFWWANDIFVGSYAAQNVYTAKYVNTVGRTVYINSTSVGTNSATNRSSTNINNTIGSDLRSNYGAGANHATIGGIYNVCIFNIALTDSDRILVETYL